MAPLILMAANFQRMIMITRVAVIVRQLTITGIALNKNILFNKFLKIGEFIIFSGFWFDGTQCCTTLVPNLNGVYPATNYTCFNEVGYAGLLWTPLTGPDIERHQSLHYSNYTNLTMLQ